MSVPTSSRFDQVLHDALTLSPAERAQVAESLLSSLDRPDPALDQLWLREAKDRLAAFHRGEMDAIDADDVFNLTQE